VLRRASRLRVTNGSVIEVLMGSLELPINGRARPNAEDARLVPTPDLSMR